MAVVRGRPWEQSKVQTWAGQEPVGVLLWNTPEEASSVSQPDEEDSSADQVWVAGPPEGRTEGGPTWSPEELLPVQGDAGERLLCQGTPKELHKHLMGGNSKVIVKYLKRKWFWLLHYNSTCHIRSSTLVISYSCCGCRSLREGREGAELGTHPLPTWQVVPGSRERRNKEALKGKTKSACVSDQSL